MMRDALLNKIRDHKDNFVERKLEGVTNAELRQTVSAFANTVPEGRHAVLFIGLHDKTGEILGGVLPVFRRITAELTRFV
ncbi:MAG: RNA-binding domain-containing protein [Acidiferrobacterales bacterium]